MIKELKRKLIYTYTITTGVILTFVVILTLFASFWRSNESRMQTFYNNFTAIANKVQYGNSISSLWLAAEENKNQLVISIEENGVPLKLMRSKETGQLRNEMIGALKKHAMSDDINPEMAPVSVSEIQSEVYKWEDKDSMYYGKVCVYSMDKGFRSLLLVKKFPNIKKERRMQYVYFTIIDLFGILLLFIASVWFVKKSIKPIEESKKRQDEFVAAASHELRSPLAVLKANLALLQMPKSDTDYKESNNSLHVMEEECNRMAVLIEDMLLLASADADNWKMQLMPIEVENLLIEMYESYLPLCNERKIRLKLDLQEEEIGKTLGDKIRMKQILSILLDNAMRFSPEREEIVIRGRMLSGGKKWIQIEIEDHGIGVSAEKREQIFERFYQEDQSRSDKKHFGLGLSIAKELVTVQKGKIYCTETKNGGATFILQFLEID